MSASTAIWISALCSVLPLAAQSQRKPGSPLDHLPLNIEVVTHFGERADVSPDNQRVAFLRVMHLSTGDYLLIGPEKFTNIFLRSRLQAHLHLL